MSVQIKRIYEEVSQDDGIRILVDRLWPRGMSKDAAKLNYWLKEIGPSNDLRKWFSHEPVKYNEFKEKYKEELRSGDQQKALKRLKSIVKENEYDQQITLLFAAKEEKHNHVKVLRKIVVDLP